MPRPEIVTVEGAISGTLHDGKNMIVLREGKKVKVAKSSLPFLREKQAIKELTQLDHDHDGAPGGSKPQSDDRKAAAALYREAVGKNPGPGWGADTILAKLAEHEAAKGSAEAPAGDGAPGGEEAEAIEAVADGETHEAQLGGEGDQPAAPAIDDEAPVS